MNKDEYNALIHAIWHIDRLLKSEPMNDSTRARLERDRKALSGLHARL
jgi:uncharacterized membrane protein YqjE